MFAKVMGKERKGCIRGVGFGPSPSGRSSKSALTDLQIRLSQSRDDEVAQLKASLAKMQEKLPTFDEMKERLSQFEKMEQKMPCLLQQVQQITSQCSQVDINDFDFGVSKALGLISTLISIRYWIVISIALGLTSWTFIAEVVPLLVLILLAYLLFKTISSRSCKGIWKYVIMGTIASVDF
ncbi:hypothetical protein SO802_005652 [Lithocarpus litseifolius]|uniref:Uncharacterized protein n=1 Tax=Lithocarpus litseifolius TaxID=425828 RepID=A0AAW2DK39_9ROSI